MKTKWFATWVLFVGATITPTWAATLFDANVTPDVIFGSGNPNGNFTVDQSNGIELGLRAKIPFVGTTNSNGDGTYSYTVAEQEAAPDSGSCPSVGGCWNFDWTVNTDYLDSSGVKIDELTYLLEIDFEPDQSTNFLAFDSVTPGVAPLFAAFFDHSIGDNTTANGAGVEAGDGPTYAGLIASKNVLQQSWRTGFFAFHPTLTYDPTVDATYDVVLTAFDSGGGVVARTSIQVIVGAGGAIPVGSCCNFDGTCTESVIEAECMGQAQIWTLHGSCEDAVCAAVPTVSEWALVVMTLLGCSIGTLIYRSSGRTVRA